MVTCPCVRGVDECWCTVPVVRNGIFVQQQGSVLCMRLCFCLQFEEWEQHNALLGSYIKTQTTPRIFYLPKAHNKTTSELLESTKSEIAGTHFHVQQVLLVPSGRSGDVVCAVS